MMIKKRRIGYVLLGAIVIVFSLIIIAYLVQKHRSENTNQSIIVVGLTDGQDKYFKKELSSASKISSLIKMGKKLFEGGDYDGAILSFQAALSASKMGGEKNMSMEYMVDVYEKKRDYANALSWMIKVRDNCPEWSKKPSIERVRYLEYALSGDYNRAIQHAEKAVEEYMIIHSDMPVQKHGYTARISDLVAAKDYIESLKKN